MDTEETKTEQLPLVPKTIRVQAEDNELWKKVKLLGSKNGATAPQF